MFVRNKSVEKNPIHIKAASFKLHKLLQMIFMQAFQE